MRLTLPGLIPREHERDARAYMTRRVRALRARYFPRPDRKRARESATPSSSTRSSAPNAASRSLSTLSTPSSREANFIEMRILERVSGSATSPGTSRPAPNVCCGAPLSDRQEDSDPGIMASAAEQIDHILQRRMMRGRPAGREQTFDVSQQLARGTINFQGRVLRVRKIEASVTAGAARVNGFG